MNKRKRGLLAGVAALAVITIVTPATAYGGGLIPGADIKSGSITTTDVENSSLLAGKRTQWTGQGDGYTWSNAGNWSAGVPGPEDVAVISLDYEGNCAAIEAGTVDIDGLELTLCANLYAEHLTVDEATVADEALLRGADALVTEKLMWTGSSWLVSDVTIPVGAEAESSGPGERESFVLLDVDGTLVLDGGTTIGWNDGINVGGTVRLDSSSRIGGSTQFVSTGAVQVGAHTLTFEGGEYLDGASFLTSGTTTTLAGGAVQLKSGMHEFRPGAHFAGNGLVRVSTGGGGDTGTRLYGHGVLDVDPGVTFEFAGGYQHDPLIVQDGTFSWTGGHLSALTVGAAAEAVVAGDDPKDVFGGLVNKGTMTWNAGSPIEVWNDGIRNEGTLVVADDTVLEGAGPVVSLGELRLEGATLTVDGASLQPSGVVALEPGIIRLKTGSHTLADGLSIAGSGTLQVSSELTGEGTVGLADDVTLAVDKGPLRGVFLVDGGTMRWTRGPIWADLTVMPDTAMIVAGEAAKEISGTFVNDGSLDLSGGPVELSDGLLNRGVVTVDTPMRLLGSGVVNNARNGMLGLDSGLTLRGPTLSSYGRVKLGLWKLALGDGGHALKGSSILQVSVKAAIGRSGSITSTDQVDLDGKVVVAEIGKHPAAGKTFTLVTAKPRSGKFASVSGKWSLKYTPNTALLRAR